MHRGMLHDMTETIDQASSALAEIRERYEQLGPLYRNTAFLLDAVVQDVPVLLAAIEAVLKLADHWRAVGSPESAEEETLMWQQIESGDALREAITAAVTGKDSSDGE